MYDFDSYSILSGVTPSTDFLAACGLEMTKSGHITVDKVKQIYKILILLINYTYILKKKLSIFNERNYDTLIMTL